MPRYLTPARICLLVLVRLYQSGQASTASSLQVLEFIARRTSAAFQHDRHVVSDQDGLCSPEISQLGQKLQQWSSRIPGRSMYDVLLQGIWDLNGLDSLNTLVSQLRRISEPILEDEEEEDRDLAECQRITPSSPLGQFVRRCYVEFTRLQFADSQMLWNSFAMYRSSTRDEWTRQNPDAATNLLENDPSTNMFPPDRSLPVSVATASASNASTVDTDMLLGFAIHQLQKVGARVPAEVKSRLEAWIDDQLDSSTQSLHFFMAFFEYWRAGQYTMALESLHRYFDYSLAGRSGADNMKVFYQYALLHLSVLHADFECWDESVDAMNECIATARENQDAACLNFALSWLLYLRHAHPDKNHSSYSTVSGVVGSNGGERDEVQFLKTKAKEGKHWMLLSSTLLEEARLEMFIGGSLNRAYEHIVQAMYLNIQHDLRSLAPSALLFHGASLDRLGQSHLASRGYELATTVHNAHCPLNDRVRSACRIAQALMQAGFFSKALTILDNLASEVSGVLKLDQKVKAIAALMQLKRRMRHGDTDAADYYLGQLRPLRSTSDPEIVFEINLLEIELLIIQKQLERASRKTNARLAELKGRGTVDLAQRLHLLILKSRIFALGGQASKGFAIALRATSAAERHLLIPVFLEGLGALGRILIDLSEFAMARSLLESALPRALESNNVHLTAHLFVAMGEACVGLAGHSCSPGSSEQTRTMRTALDLIERGRLAFQRTEDTHGQADCLLMKSRISMWDGDENSVLQADNMYQQLIDGQRDSRPV